MQPHRTQLTVSHMAAPMFILLTGPPLEKWDPMPFVIRGWHTTGMMQIPVMVLDGLIKPVLIENVKQLSHCGICLHKLCVLSCDCDNCLANNFV